jgi:hypothetical protein
MSTVSLADRIKTPDGINYLNIGLMLLSFALAFMIPFELFLFAYAVLGPLHYLTEISWLQKKDFFIRSKWDIFLFILVSLALMVGAFDQKSVVNTFGTGLICTGFIFSLVILFVERTWVKVCIVLASLFLFAVFDLNKVMALQLLFAIFLPTIIHVFVFTGAFILFGALKSRSVSGISSLAVFIVCAMACFLIVPHSSFATSEYVQKTYKMFSIVNKSISDLFGMGAIGEMNDVFTNAKAIAIMRFIAFAYTYHYLNWFSKTSVIKWHEISKGRLTTILILWLLSVAVYAYNYKVGFFALFLLSILHVFLEFPLNNQTFIGIGKELRTVFRPK